MRDILVIINPISGVRPKDEMPVLVREVLTEEAGCHVDVRFTEYAGHASKLAKEAVANGMDTVVAIGGDGTVNETARSLVGSNVKFGIVPMGSGNGLARHAQIPLDATRALECIRDGHAEAVDYGTVNDQIFFCTAGIGFDARVSARFAEIGNRGPINYLRSFVSLLGDYKPATYEIYTDDGLVKEKAFLIAIGNASQWGNNAFITPHASMQDGLLDVTLVKPFPIIEVPHMALQLFTKQLDTNPNILSFRSQQMRIVMPQPDVIHVDGEPMQMDGVLNIQTHCGQLLIICPENPTTNVLEPIRYAFEDIHYSIQNNLKEAVRQLEDLNKPVVKAAEQVAIPVVKAAEQVAIPVVKAAEQVTKPVIKRLHKPVIKRNKKNS